MLLWYDESGYGEYDIVPSMSGREKKLPCSGCIYEEICGGGCRRMRKEVYCGSGIDGCGMRIFLDYSMKELQNIAEKERNFRSRSIAGIPEWFGRLY